MQTLYIVKRCCTGGEASGSEREDSDGIRDTSTHLGLRPRMILPIRPRPSSGTTTYTHLLPRHTSFIMTVIIDYAPTSFSLTCSFLFYLTIFCFCLYLYRTCLYFCFMLDIHKCVCSVVTPRHPRQETQKGVSLIEIPRVIFFDIGPHREPSGAGVWGDSDNDLDSIQPSVHKKADKVAMNKTSYGLNVETRIAIGVWARKSFFQSVIMYARIIHQLLNFLFLNLVSCFRLIDIFAYFLFILHPSVYTKAFVTSSKSIESPAPQSRLVSREKEN